MGRNVIRGISFDLFDTLIDERRERLERVEVAGKRVSPSLPRIHDHLVAVLGSGTAGDLDDFARVHRDLDRALAAETLAVGLELPTRRRFEALSAHFGVEDPDLVQALTDLHMDMLREAVLVPPHHEAVLSSLAVEQRLALCSNFSHAPAARAILDEAGFTPHFDTVVISEDVGFRKPRPEMFEILVDRLGCDAGEILHVGDNLSADVAGAAEAGLRTVWLTRRIEDPEAMLAAHSGPPPDFALDDLLDLPVLVARLNA